MNSNTKKSMDVKEKVTLKVAMSIDDMRERLYEATREYQAAYISSLSLLKYVSEKSELNDVERDIDSITKDMLKWMYYFSDKYEDIDTTARKLTSSLMIKFIKAAPVKKGEEKKRAKLISDIEKNISNCTFDGVFQPPKNPLEGDKDHGQKED
jgi:hypothetical protein